VSTPSTMIINALILTGEKSIGGTLSAAEQTHWLAQLNSMMESWSLDRLMCFQLLQESKALTTGTSSYTIGTGGAFNTDRPNKIEDPCYTIDSGNIRTGIEIIPIETYRRLSVELSGNSHPRYLAYDSAFAAGLATIFLYPAPSAGLTLYINSWKQLQTFANISTTVVLPPGYQLAIETNFALYASAGLRDAPGDVARIARDSKAAIKSLNVPDMNMRIDSGVNMVVGRRSGNILTGAW